MLEVKELVKRYGDHTAVDHLSFSVGEKQVFGFLGPNGAGKSTTMNIITGTLSATEGSVIVDGFDVFRQSKQARGCIGYLPELPPLYSELTPAEYLSFVAQAKGLSKDVRKAAIDEAMELTHITDMKNRLIANLSKGYRQRVGMAQAIMGNPQLLILDEPMVGLDPQQIIDVRALITELGKKCTVILSSHILSEISAVCDQVLIIAKGRFVAQGSPGELEMQAEHGPQCRLTVPEAELDRVCSAIEGVTGLNVCKKTLLTAEGTAAVTVGGAGFEQMRSSVSAALMENKCHVLGMEEYKADLEQVFLELTKQTHEQAGTEEGWSR